MVTDSGVDLAAAIEAIDSANAEDPRAIERDGTARPLEVVHAERMTFWLTELDPQAAPEQLVAARAHHFRRWTRPRTDYPEGRAGYLKWRKEARAAHAAEVAAILGGFGHQQAFIDRVGVIMRKEGLGRDAQVQTHEDALCLTFLELQAEAFLGSRLPDEVERIVAKTLAKMSDQAKGVAVQRGLLAT